MFSSIQRGFTISRTVTRIRGLASRANACGPDDKKVIPEPEESWSVRQLLASYPTPSLSAEKLARMHVLSGLEMPDEGSEEYAKIKAEMENLVRLVEAVRLAPSGLEQIQQPPHAASKESSSLN